LIAMKKIVTVLLIAVGLGACSVVFRRPEEGIIVRERAQICFRQAQDRAHVLASVTPSDCYSMRCTIPYQTLGTVVLDQREFSLDFETTFKLRESKPLLGGCGRDCSGGGYLEFDLGQLEVGLYRVNLWGIHLGDLSVTSGLPWRDQCLPAEIAAVGADEGLPDEAAAQQALVDFFERLHAGDYAAAADLYGGSYEPMLAHNPELDPSNHTALFQAACTINGAQCLTVASAEPISDGADGDIVFRVRFATNDGSIFVLGPCCGGSAGGSQSEFTFHVRKTAEYLFLVMDPPVYSP
jgi:hypothetical protein